MLLVRSVFTDKLIIREKAIQAQYQQANHVSCKTNKSNAADIRATMAKPAALGLLQARITAQQALILCQTICVNSDISCY